MNANVKDLWAKVKGFFLSMNKKVRLLLCGSVIIVLAVAIIAALVLANRPYTVLFTGLSNEEARAIVSYLEENGVTEYRMEGSDTIMVPSQMESKLKATLLMQGYPKSGFAYETYRSAVNSMSTESDRNMAYLQDLQDRMAAVIRCLDGVKDAVVTIVPEEDRRYILDSSSMTSASASVMVTMSGGSSLSNQQADAIRNLIARSVKGLDISNIAISDSLGNTYSGSASGSVGSTLDASMLKLQLEDEVNRSVRNQILQVLSPLFGDQNIRVAVNSTVDVSHSVGEKTTYTEPTWAADGSTNGRGIIGSQVYDREIVRDQNNTTGGVAGTTTNSDISTYMQNNAQVNGNEPYIRDSGTTNYNVNTQKDQVERWAGVVSDLMVSVTLNSDTVKGLNRDDLMAHIARAAGITPDVQANKISIYLGPFYSETTPGILPGANDLPFPAWVLYAAAGGLALLLVLLSVLLVLRKKKKKKLSQELSALFDEPNAFPAAHAESPGLDIMNIKTEKSMELRKTIRQFAEENPEIAAFMLKSWLREEDQQRA